MSVELTSTDSTLLVQLSPYPHIPHTRRPFEEHSFGVCPEKLFVEYALEHVQLAGEP